MAISSIVWRPDSEVIACGWFEFERDQKKPTRRQRAKYATQGGLPDDFIMESDVDVEHLHDGAIAAINELSKYTHVRPGTVVSNSSEIGAFVRDAFDALVGLFASFDECRDKIQRAIFDHVNRETISALLSETIQSLDELSTHHSIDEIYVDYIRITSITHEAVNFVVTGSVGVELQWGSNSDVRRGDGALMDQSFPFQLTMWAPVDEITSFEDVDYTVDTTD